MSGRLILTLSAGVLFLCGGAGLFAADEVGRILAPAPSPTIPVVVQLAASGLLGFSMLNWMSRAADRGHLSSSDRAPPTYSCSQPRPSPLERPLPLRHCWRAPLASASFSRRLPLVLRGYYSDMIPSRATLPKLATDICRQPCWGRSRAMPTRHIHVATVHQAQGVGRSRPRAGDADDGMAHAVCQG